MVDMCRKKKTGIAEECRQSDGKRTLRACTECGISYWEPVEFFQKRCDMIMLRFVQDEPYGVVVDLLYVHRLLLRRKQRHYSSPILT